MKFIIALLLTFLYGCSSLPADRAQEAAMSDIATTGVGLALGAAEMNPLGLLTLPLKYGLLEYAKTLPNGEKQEAQIGMESVWGGASINNACVIVAILTGGAFAPACIPIGIASGIYKWTNSQYEREFWKICAEETKKNPNTACVFRS